MSEIGTIINRGNKKYKLLSVSEVNDNVHNLHGTFECWHKWIKSKGEYTKNPSFYLKVQP